MSSGAQLPKRILSRFSLAHGLMIVAGLLTFVTVARVLDARDATTEVVVVVEQIVAGAPIDLDAVEVVEVAMASEEIGGLAPPDAAEGMVARRDLTPGEPLLASDLMAPTATELPRTYTLAVESHIIDGLGLTQGDRVDLIGLDATNWPYYVVVGAPVARLSSSNESGALAVTGGAAWVTVAVSDDDVLALAAAQSRGAIGVVRSTGAPAPAAELAQPSSPSEVTESGQVAAPPPPTDDDAVHAVAPPVEEEASS